MRLTRPRLLLAIAALIVAGWCAPARAAIRADFDGDGVLDSATLESGTQHFIQISLSGADQPIVLALRERPLSLIAADLNRDGRVDLAGLSGRRGLVLFQNDDGARFTRLRRPLRVPREALVVVVASGGLDSHSAAAGDSASYDSERRDDGGPPVDRDTRAGSQTFVSSPLFLTHATPLDAAPDRSASPRAPPS